ncbi:DUF4262 domain-containing protein [Streptomyces sp. NPDC002734]|uniref:DUF4262 domain-containing protein n=1 Tax=Streptomyces sp. NPDC002734 TaxID=3154426 RepID=UPI003322D8AF
MSNERAACHCVICHDYGDRGEATALDEHTVRHVQDHGWSVVMVPADEQGPGFAYTVGLLHSHGVPELAMFGLDVQLMHALLNELGRQAADGTALEDGGTYEGVIEGRSVALRAAKRGWYREFFGRAIAFYRKPPLPVLQVVWPDAENRFVWEPTADPRFEDSQPRLWMTPDEHPAGVWATLVGR